MNGKDLVAPGFSPVGIDIEPGSFRDRNGRVLYHDGKVYRLLSRHSLQDWQKLSRSRFYSECVQTGHIVETHKVDFSVLPDFDSGDWAALLEHQKVPFISYPYEWSFEMLKRAALLHLQLISKSLEEDMILKDATAFNIQWRGTKPVFIDIPSFEQLSPGTAWMGYRQFCQLFLFPLFLQAYKHLPFHSWLRGSLDGISPQSCRAVMSLRDLVRPGVFLHVHLQNRFQHRYAGRSESTKGQLKELGFGKTMIQKNLANLQKIIQRLKWEPFDSAWSEYVTEHTYQAADHQTKKEFVARATGSRHRSLAWDLGCNIGNFTRVLAKHSDYVVALDQDHVTIDRLFTQLSDESCRNILPLVFNLADPSPDLGWWCKERKNLESRGRPDMILALALVHHMVIGANVPLSEFISWLASFPAELVIEFVTKDDSMVQALLRNKADQYSDYDLRIFRRLLANRYEILEEEPLTSGTRVLFHARPKAA